MMKSQTGAMSVESNLTLAEKSRDAYWRRYQRTTPIPCPGETKYWNSEHGVDFARCSCQEFCRAKILFVGAAFYSDFLEQANEKKIASAKFILIKNLTRELQEASFDYRPSEGAIDYSIVANHNPAAEIFNLGHHRHIKNDGDPLALSE